METVPTPKTNEEAWEHMKDTRFGLHLGHGFEGWNESALRRIHPGLSAIEVHEADHQKSSDMWGHDHAPLAEDPDGAAGPGGTVMDRG